MAASEAAMEDGQKPRKVAHGRRVSSKRRRWRSATRSCGTRRDGDGDGEEEEDIDCGFGVSFLQGHSTLRQGFDLLAREICDVGFASFLLLRIILAELGLAFVFDLDFSVGRICERYVLLEYYFRFIISVSILS